MACARRKGEEGGQVRAAVIVLLFMIATRRDGKTYEKLNNIYKEKGPNQ